MSESKDPGTGSGENSVTIKLLCDRPLIWKAEDWLTLQEHKIYGSLIGTPATAPRQIAENGLPVVLMPEEVTFILEKGIGKIYRYKKERDFPSETIKREYENFLDENKRQQTEYYKRLCTEQVLAKVDTIIDGKRKKLFAKRNKEAEEYTEPEIDRNALIKSEVERRLAAATNTLLVEIPTSSPYLCGDNLEPAEWNYPETSKEKVKYAVYKDLYDKGYSMTPAAKFGGDFLAYPGEHWKFHAYFIIKCLEFNEELKCQDLIKHARLGVFTRKNFVIASVDEGGIVTYSTFTWPGKLT